MTTYYVDQATGNDGDDGLSFANAWGTMGKLAITNFAPGDVILGSGTFRETWYLNTGGSLGNPVTYRANGTWKVTGCDLLSGWTAVPVGSALFADGFESGNISAWSSSVNPGGQLTVTAPAALVGTKGLSVAIAGSVHAYVQDNTPASEKTYRCRFYVDPNSLTMANGNEFIIFRALTSGGASCFFIKLQYFTVGGYRLFFFERDDAFSAQTYTVLITDAPHYVEMSWKASSAPGANNGTFAAWIDGVAAGAQITGIDSDTLNVDTVRMGAELELDAGTSGTMYFDAFYSNNTGDAIGATDPISVTNVYQASYVDSIDTYVLLQDDVHLTRVASLGALTSVGKFYADNAANLIYARCTDDADPDTHVMEIGARYDTVVCDDRQYIVFDGIHMHGAGGQYGRSFGLKPTWNTPTDITLQDCTLSHAYYAGVWAAYAATFTGMDAITLLRCVIHDNLTFGARIEGENASHRMTNVLIDDCTIYDNGNATFGEQGVFLNHLSAPEVTNSHIYDNNGYLDWSDNLYIGDSPNAYIDKNTLHGGNHSGIHFDVHTYGRIHRNKVYACGWNAIWIEEHQTSAGDATTIYANTCYHNLHGLVFGPGSTIFEVSSVTFKDNIFALNRRANVELNEDNLNPSYLNNTGDYNLYQTDSTDPLYEGEFRAQSPRVNLTFPQWQAYTGWDAHSLDTDPLFANAAALDFTLQATSPARGAGVNVGLILDFADVLYLIPPDMGAFQSLFNLSGIPLNDSRSLKGATDTRVSQMCYSNRQIVTAYQERSLKGATDTRRIQTIYSEGA